MSVEFSDSPKPTEVTRPSSTPPDGAPLGVEEKPQTGIRALAPITDMHPQAPGARFVGERTMHPAQTPLAVEGEVFTPTEYTDVPAASLWDDSRPADWKQNEAEIHAGDESAWSAWVEARSGQFTRTAARIVGSDRAPEVVQEGWAKAFKARESYREGNAHGWMHRITTNAALDVVRRDNIVAQDATDPSDMPEPEGALIAHTSPAFRTPEEGSGDEPTKIEALACKLKEAKVNPDFVDALALNLSGLSYQEIADLTGATLGTVRSRLNRGKEAVGKLIAAGEADTIFDPDMLEQYTGKKTDTPEV